MSVHKTSASPSPPLPSKGSRARGLALIVLSLAPFLFGLLALALGQDANWDLRNYHWYNAYALLGNRYDLDILASQIPSFYNPALDVPYFLLASAVPAKVAAFILGSVQGLNFVLIFMLCHATLIISNPRQKVWVCAALAALGMLGGGGIAQIGTTFFDNITSLGLFASAFFVIRNFEAMIHGRMGRAFALALLCGFPAGLMMGLKLPFVVFCVGLCGALLFVTGKLTRRVWIAFGFGVGILIGLALSLGPWAYHLQTTFGSPLFPYFNNIFQSPLAPAISSRDVQFLPFTWSDRLLFPFIFTLCPWRVGEIPWRDLRLPILYVLVPLCVGLRLLFGRTKKNAPDRVTTFYASRYLLWAASLSYIVWLFLFAIYRYAIPLEMIAPLLIVVVMGMLPVRPQIRALLTAFILIVIASTIQPGNWGRKTPWIESAVKVGLPPLGDTSNLMILMAGFEPYSHVIPAFPPEIAFVRVQSNFASPEEDKGINKVIAQRVAAHQGAFKLLLPKTQFFHAIPTLNHFGLTFSPQNCQAVEDYIFDSKLELCDVHRNSTAQTKQVKP